MKINHLSIVIFLFATGLFSGCSGELTEEQIIEKAAKIHEAVLTIDTHNDTPMKFNRTEYNMGERHDVNNNGGRVDFPRMKEGGLDGAFFAVFVGQGPRDTEGNKKAYERAMKTFKAIHTTVEKHKDLVGLALSPEDAYQLEKEGKRALFIGAENGYPIGDDIKNVQKFYDQGARYITLCHTKNNSICDSSTDRNGTEHDGLSDFGVDVVKEMNRLGIMVDMSHASDKSFYDVIEHSAAPIIASHSCAWALCENPRNLKDEMLMALAENGGVIQMCILSNYLKSPEPNPEKDAEEAALRTKYNNFQDLSDEEMAEARKAFNDLREKYPRKLATCVDVVDHIDHVVKVAGIDHVGIGTDFDGGGGIDGCADVSEMGNITIELVRRGYSKKEIEKIWGGNIMRVMSEVEEVAESF